MADAGAIKTIQIGSDEYELDSKLFDGQESSYYQEKNLKTSVNSSSTDTEYLSSKCVYDNFGNKIVNQSGTSASIAPNVFNVWGTVSSLTITLATPSDSSRMNEYMLQFTCPSSSATTFSYPSAITWCETEATKESGGVIIPNIEAGKTYQVSIVNSKGVIGGF